MVSSTTEIRGTDLPRVLSSTQRLYGRIEDLPALLDVMAQTLIELLEEVAPIHAEAEHVLGAAGLLSRENSAGTFHPMSLRGRPDPDELRSFVEHVAGDSEQPMGLMGWSVARRKVGMRQGREWFVADRDDQKDRWDALRPATEDEAAQMRAADIKAYPSLKSQLTVPVLDPEIRGQARPRDPIGILNVESDELLSKRFSDVMMGFSSSAGYPLRAASRLGDLRRLSRRLSGPVTRALVGAALIDSTHAYLPGEKRHGLVALREAREGDYFIVTAMTPGGLDEERAAAFRAGRLDLMAYSGIWHETVRTGRTLSLPDVPRGARGHQRPFWEDSQSALVVPLVSGHAHDVLGLLVLESGETSYAFSTQDKGFFEMQASMAAVAAAGLGGARLEYADAVRTSALLQRNKRTDLSEIPEDQIVRINMICRALVKHGFSFPRAAEECRLTVHILREYTSRSPRIIDVDALRTLAARREEALRVAIQTEGRTW